ncbi:MAG: hypothetical protein ACK4E3_10540 [Brevundimonas sp.]|uniref:hypothetical protein n=1 Tax=Brevundimonas sp. TaxID=1871086 RepID=UPI003919D0DE
MDKGPEDDVPAQDEAPANVVSLTDAKKKRARSRGRAALMEAPGQTRGGGGGGGGAGGGDDEPRIYRALRIPRITAEGTLTYASIDLETGVHAPCPVQPLGNRDGVCFFLDPLGQLVALDGGKMGQNHLRALFGRHCDWLNRAFPQFNQHGTWKGFAAQYAAEALIKAASDAGTFDTRDKVRGLGCWRSEDGQLVQHLGDHVLVGSERHDPGQIGEHVYPGRPPLKPGIDKASESQAAMREVFAHFDSWAWSRPDLDPRLLLGWMGCCVLGAALEWRPMIFITGDAGTGKSTLQETIKKMLPGRLVGTVDATPAALRQIINNDAIGVSFDEIEADVTTDQAVQVMKLARVAASGGTVYRGGTDHKASEFQLRGCFAFSAIMAPSMRAQDMQRVSFLRLFPLPKDRKLAKRTDAEWRELGQQLVARVVAGWDRFEDTLEAYEAALIEMGGHNQRGARQYGTLMAVADLILHDTVPDASAAAGLVAGLERTSLYEYERSEPLWLTLFRHILTAQPEPWRSDGFPSVGEIVRRYLRAADTNLEEASNMQRKLNRAGLAVVRERSTGRFFLAIPGKHQQISAMFANQDARAHGGDGAWTGALRNARPYDREEGTGVWRSANVPQLDRERCVQVWLDAKVEINGHMVPIFERDPSDETD